MVFMFHKRVGFLIMTLGVTYFLLTLPSTGMDYGAYKQAFDNSYISADYPWFKTRSRLTAEPFYLWYSSFFGVVLPFGFPSFLAINFLICLGITKLLFNKFNPETILYFWLFFLPVILPTIFYFSPRSSLSFILVLWGFIGIIKKQYWWAALFLFGASMTHSQYLLSIFLIVGTYLCFYRVKFNYLVYKNIIIAISIILFLLLRFMDKIGLIIANLLSFLPSVNIITAKMNYFESEDGGSNGFRLTAILSIIIYPILSYNLVKIISKTKENFIFQSSEMRKSEITFVYLLFALMIYGAVINLAFIDEPHIAGRLSRFSDYVGMGIILPLYLRLVFTEATTDWVLIILCLLAPILFASLYLNVSWLIF